MNPQNDARQLIEALFIGTYDSWLLWQAAAVVLSLLLGYVVSYLMQRRTQVSQDQRWKLGQSGFKRVAFPLASIVIVILVRFVMRHWQPVPLLNVAVPLIFSYILIRMLVFALRHAFLPSAAVAVFERVVGLFVWSAVALYITGFLTDVIAFLEAASFSVGKEELNLWLILQGMGTVFFTVLLALWIGGLIEERLNRNEKLDLSLRVVFSRITKTLLVVVAILIVLPLVGIDLTTLSVFGGALGVGLGFGLQKIASNYVSGFIILLDRSIRIGNMITLEGNSGEVTQITTRYTVVRSLGGAEAIVPNEMLVSAVVLNQTYTNPEIRQSIAVQVSYGSDIERAMQILTEVAAQHERVLNEPSPRSYLVNFGDSGIDLELGFWIADPIEGTLNVKSDLNVEIWRTFRREGVEIPFPQREIRVLKD